ncbi:MAG TPA: transposase [Ktedonobacteraceae bacterium]|nr:transposase [Ktedonobacteraceae bacterium]
MKQKRQRGKKIVKPQTITKAVTHIRLLEANPGKLAALNELAPIYLALCQEYVTYFCTEGTPDKFHAPVFATPLSERWHRVAIQQAAGVAQSWRTNRANGYQAYLDERAEYREWQTEGTLDTEAKEPVWQEWDVPALQQTCIQANANVVALGPSEDSCFDYWLKISTLAFRKPLLVPVKLADYHREALKDKTINSSVRLNKRNGAWWLTLSYDVVIPIQTEADAPVIGIDVGIANFVTTSEGKHYGTFHGKLRERQKRDREKRRRKARLRACLKKKGVKKLPSTSSKSGQRLRRHVRQEINRAVNVCLDEHPDAQIAYEHLSVASMKFKARAMNAYLRASNLARIPEKIAWETAKRGIAATRVKSAYSSQECSVCHYPDRANRPDQQTFCCVVCGYSAHADLNAATNIERRLVDTELHACKRKEDVKAVLIRRHEIWKNHNGWP